MRVWAPVGGVPSIVGRGSSAGAASDVEVERLAQDAAQYIQFVSEWKVSRLVCLLFDHFHERCKKTTLTHWFLRNASR